MQPLTTIYDYLITQKPSPTTHNQSQTPKKLPKKAKTCHKQLCYCSLDVNTERDVDFDSDMRQCN